jgi:hypothetical protein
MAANPWETMAPAADPETGLPGGYSGQSDFDPTKFQKADETSGFDFGKYGHAMMALSGLVTGAGDIINGINQAAALKSAASYNQWKASENLKRAGMQTAELQQETAAQLAMRGGAANRAIAQTRVGAASQGVNVNSGTAMDLQVQQGKIAAVDALTIRNNAALKAWGIDTGALETSGQQNLQALAENTEAQQSLMLGGAQAARDMMESEKAFQAMRSRAL